MRYQQASLLEKLIYDIYIFRGVLSFASSSSDCATDTLGADLEKKRG